MQSNQPDRRIPAPPMNLQNRHKSLPRVSILNSHPLVPHSSGRIVLLLIDTSAEAKRQAYNWASVQQAPKDDHEICAKGFVKLYTGDVVVVRSCGAREDDTETDRVVSWGVPKSNLPPGYTGALSQVQARLIGPPEEHTSGKPTFSKAEKSFHGGVFFERTARAIPTANGPRCYQTGLTFQRPKLLISPGKQNKSYSDDDKGQIELQRELIKISSQVAMHGLRAQHLSADLDVLNQHANVTNLPRLGTDDNIAYPAMQLNLTSAVLKNKRTETSFSASLGKFANTHIDEGDSPTVPTAMIVLSPSRDDIDDEWFHVMDLGLSWCLSKFSTFYFSGLHWHGGTQPVFKNGVSDGDRPYTRMVLIAYPAQSMLEPQGGLALAASKIRRPAKKHCQAGDLASDFLSVGLEMRNPQSHSLSRRAFCEQATFIADGHNLMEERSFLNFMSRSIGILMMYLVHQANPRLLFRVDKDKLLASMSMIVDGVRRTLTQWPEGPGWSTSDTEEGLAIMDAIQNAFPLCSAIPDLDNDQLAALYNLYSLLDAPYGNPSLMDPYAVWQILLENNSMHIPSVEAEGLGGRMGKVRKPARNKAKPSKVSGHRKVYGTRSQCQQNRGTTSTDESDGSVSGEFTDDEGDPSVSCPSASTTHRPTRSVPQPWAEPESTPNAFQSSGHGHPNNEVYSEEGEETNIAGKEYEASPESEEETYASGHLPDNTLNSATSSVDETPGSRYKKERVRVHSFLNSFQLENLQALEEQIRISQDEANSDIVALLAQCGHAMPSEWRTQPLYMHELTKTSYALQVASAKNTVWAMCTTKHRLLLEVALWDWLDSAVAECLCRSKAGDTSHPLFPLVGRVSSALLNPLQPTSFDASQYFVGFIPQNNVYTPKCPKQVYKATEHVHDTAVDVISHLLDFPAAETRTASWFMKELKKHINDSALLLPGVAQALMHVNTCILNRDRQRTISQADVDQWSSETLQQCRITDETSEERMVLTRIQDICQFV